MAINETKKPMRELMPTTAQFIDELRAVFGEQSINDSIKKGMAGQSGYFWAEENGQQLGTK